VHEPTIRAQVSGAIPLSSKPGSNVLLYMIFAMGAFDLATSPDGGDGDRFYQAAWEALQRDMLEQGTIELVQGLAIMANYLQRSNRPNAGYICLGIAIRMAFALGLHTPTTSASPLERETRTRVWWALVTLEAGCSVTFGRPHAFGAMALRNIRLPINCDDEHLTVSTVNMPTDVTYATQYTALIIQSHLARATCSIHDQILQSHPAPSIERVKSCDERFVQLFNDIPPYMLDVQQGPHRLARSIQLWRARDFRAILYRPVLLAAAWDSSRRKTLGPLIQQAIATCRSLAQDNLIDITAYVAESNDHSRGAEWYLLYFAFQSSLTLLLSAVWEPDHADAPKWRTAVMNTARWFRELHSMQRVSLPLATET
jgi:transcriptional regulatory protein GAL4